MEYTPLYSGYRSQSCKELAERVASGFGVNSLNVTYNIDVISPNRNTDDINQVLFAIQENTNFVLFADKSHYVIIIPCKLAVVCYVDGKQETMEIMKDMHQFQNRVKIAFAVYDKFHRLDRSIKGGGNGNESLPFYPDGENLSNRKDGA